MTLTLNPLMGHFSATYAVRGGTSAFCSRFEFNMYSYESDLVLGLEVWRRQATSSPTITSNAATGVIDTDSPDMFLLDEGMRKEENGIKQDFAGVLKARMTPKMTFGLLWEGRIKQLLFTVGGSIDLKRRDQPFKAVGLELQYSS
jgi:distribution and morphology protein 10